MQVACADTGSKLGIQCFQLINVLHVYWLHIYLYVFLGAEIFVEVAGHWFTIKNGHT